MKSNSSGSVLPISLILLSVISVTTIYGMKSNLLEAKIISNVQQQETAFHDAYGLLDFTYSNFMDAAPLQSDQVFLSNLIQGSGGVYDSTDTLTVTEAEAAYTAPVSTTKIRGIQVKYVYPSISNSDLIHYRFAVVANSNLRNSPISSTQELIFSRTTRAQKNKID